MSAAEVVSLADVDMYRRLADLVAQVEHLVSVMEAGEDVGWRVAVLQDRAAALAETVQARLPWVIRCTRPVPPYRIQTRYAGGLRQFGR